ncbi:hypothetical protein H072_307 [Dactylellina haptotyla CBS 200.50]|uniref:Uncharacterized protein n=1 Tax=Dactylellina haptotyla (strain CBS 200.50) TaxID=1284197 RepID=S8ARU9_DACHA|nr:hypothetical protein H072_307 [Dactylellina haptotyla CBS 200.50]
MKTNEDYYRAYGLEFRCLDKAEILKHADERLSDYQCRNMVVDFGNDNAYVGWDFEDSQIDSIKKSWKNIHECRQTPSARWIAIFDAYEQRALVNGLLAKYGISARTRASMTSPRGKGNLEIVRKMWHWSSFEYDEKFLILGINNLHNFATPEENKGRNRDLDTVEEEDSPTKPVPWFRKVFRKRSSRDQTDELPLTSPTVQIHLDARQSSVPRLPVTDSKRHRVSQYAQKKFHREGQSQGLHANKEFSLDQADDIFDNADDFNEDHYHPRMLRLWIWLIKLDDNTIITLHEPFPPFQQDVATHDKIRNTTANVRRNIRMILKCLSAAGVAKIMETSDAYNAELAMETGALIVRQTPDQACDLLFYYLFDDWYSTWGLTVDRAHPYTKKLSVMKNENPQLYHIDELHDIVRRLATLKRVYQSYELVLNRLLEENKHLPSAPERKFGQLALTRFARLKHRITYLAIGEIAECEKEAEGLISLTFNRLNFREVQAVEKLSLLSITLVKFTIIFLPLSLIMAYFSMDVEGISGHYKAVHFWGAAGVAVFLTTTFLLCVGKINKIMLGTKKAKQNRSVIREVY